LLYGTRQTWIVWEWLLQTGSNVFHAFIEGVWCAISFAVEDFSG